MALAWLKKRLHLTRFNGETSEACEGLKLVAAGGDSPVLEKAALPPKQ
jgi:hypothetical protein